MVSPIYCQHDGSLLKELDVVQDDSVPSAKHG